MSYNVIGDIMRHFLYQVGLLILILIIFLQIPAFAVGYYYDNAYHEYTADPIHLVVNGEAIEGDMPPIILNDRTLVPAVFVFTALGADVTWLSKTRQVQVTYGNTSILLTIDSRVVKLNNKTVSIHASDPPAKIINDRTMIPVRFVAENLGLSVDWNNKTRTVSITSPKATPLPTPKPTATPVPLSGSITSVTYKNQVVTVKGTGLDQLKISKLTEPLRFVFDFEGVNFASGDKTYTYNDDCITAIRYANHPTYARLVIDVAEGTTYTYQSTSKTLTISLSSKTVATTPPTKAPSVTVAPTEKPLTTAIPSSTPTATAVPRKQNPKPIVVLDAGHGGSDPGAIGRDEGGTIVANEKDVNLDITLKVYQLLKSAKIDTYLTRKDDTYISLSERTAYANKLNADLFVSIHSNAVENTDANGTMVMYNPDSIKTTSYFTYSTELAQFVLDRLNAGTDLKNLGLRDGSGLWVIRKTAMPAILVECAFITNESDREKLTSDAYQDKIAKAIYQGILDALSKAK